MLLLQCSQWHLQQERQQSAAMTLQSACQQSLGPCIHMDVGIPPDAACACFYMALNSREVGRVQAQQPANLA